MPTLTFWLSFRLKQNKTYTERLEDLAKVIDSVSNDEELWAETTSFYLFSSSLSASTIAMHVESVIDPKVDVVVLGSTDKKVGRVIGAYSDDAIFALAPFMKKH